MALAHACILMLGVALPPASDHDLLDLVGRGDLAAVRSAIDSGVDLEARNSQGVSALILAASKGSLEIVNLLLSAGAEVDGRDKTRNTPLTYAAMGGHLPVIRALLAGGADANAEGVNRVTPLLLAAANGRTEAVSLLLKGGADAERTAANGATPLLEAIAKSNEDVAAALLAGGADPQVRTASRDTPLILAARANDADMVRVLLDGGADVDARNWNKDTALIEAVRFGSRKVVPDLLAAGADANRKGGAGSSARKMAREFEDETLVALLEGRPVPASRANHHPLAGTASAGKAVRLRDARLTEPRKLKNVPPEYPIGLLAGRVQGLVVLEAVIDTEGRVETAKVLTAPNPAFVPSAVDAVRQWRYTPTLINGVAVPVIMTVTVNFKLGPRRTVPRAVPDAASGSRAP